MTPEERSTFRLLITDIEASDLDRQYCEVLEVSLLVVDLDLKEHARQTWIADRRSLDRAKSRMSEYVLEMHTRSGLLAEISNIPLSPKANTEIEAFVKTHTHGPKLTRMTGFSVHFDREALGHADIDWDKLVHYRLCNVSTLREAARWWSPDRALHDVDKKEHLPHRSMVDCERVLQELKHYKAVLFDNNADANAGTYARLFVDGAREALDQYRADNAALRRKIELLTAQKEELMSQIVNSSSR